MQWLNVSFSAWFNVPPPYHTSAKPRLPFEAVVSAVEAVKGELWPDFRNRHGDWGCAMVLHLARQRTGLTLGEIGELAGGMGYKAVSAQVRRLRARLATQPALKRKEKACLAKLAIVETPMAL